MEKHKTVDYYQKRRIAKKLQARHKRRRILAGFVAFAFLIIFISVFPSKQSKAAKSKPAASLENIIPKKPLIKKEEKLFKIASADKTPIYLPFDKSKLTLIGYHRAYNPRSVEMIPLGTMLERDVTLKTDPKVLTDNWKKLIYVEMPRSDREGPRNSAIDIGAAHGTVFNSPVTGTVVKIKPYKLYGQYSDYELHIMPSGYKDRHVILIHIDNLMVNVGDYVLAGKTKVGKIRNTSQFFHEQITDYSKKASDHLHVQTNKLDANGNATLPNE